MACFYCGYIKLGMATETDIIIETPKGSRNKYAYSFKKKLFKLKKTLPQGMVFPFDFGYIPGTKGGDGDPVDVLIIMDEPAYPGILVKSRIIGAIKAVQKEQGDWERNDRIIAVSAESVLYKGIKNLDDLDANAIAQIEHFFTSYNEQEGKKFKVTGRLNADDAWKLVKRYKK